jgi:CheY-like chemotaxis protein/putative methionine-R-sulfoxide reductase with GAF domain
MADSASHSSDGVPSEAQKTADMLTALQAVLRATQTRERSWEQLEHVLHCITDLPWLTPDARGAIFRNEDGVLRMAAQRGLPPTTLTRCATVESGHCLCGRALEAGECLCVDSTDERHNQAQGELPPHGHCCVPIHLGTEVAGVICLHTAPGRRLSDAERRSLRAAADVVAGMVARVRLRQGVLDASRRLTAGVCFDLVNLLVVVAGYGEHAMASLPDWSPTKDDLREMLSAAGRASEVCRHVVHLARRRHVDERVMRAGDVLEGMSPYLRSARPEQIRVLLTEADKTPGCVKADPYELQGMLQQLYDDARDANSGGGDLTIKARDVVLDEVSAAEHVGARPGPYVLMSIADTGTTAVKEIGRQQPPWPRPGDTSHPRLEGVYDTARRLGGFLSVEVSPTHGTTVNVYLPRVDVPPELVEVPDDSALPRGSESILVIKGDPRWECFVPDSLHSLGYRVSATADAGEAAELIETGRPFREHPIQLILLAVDLRWSGSIGLVRSLRERSHTLPVLIVSDDPEDDATRELLSRPNTAVIHWPFSKTHLARKLREILDTTYHP